MKIKIGDFVCLDYKSSGVKSQIYQILPTLGLSELTCTIRCKEINFNEDFTEIYSGENSISVNKERLSPVKITFFDNGIKIKSIAFFTV